MTFYGAVSTASHCKISPCSFDECRLSAQWLPTEPVEYDYVVVMTTRFAFMTVR